LIFFTQRPAPLIHLAYSPSRDLLLLAKPEKPLLWSLRILGFPLQPAIDQQSSLSAGQNLISSLTSLSPTTHQPFLSQLTKTKKTRQPQPALHLPRSLYLTTRKKPTSSVFFPFSLLNSKSHRQAAARPATTIPFPSSDAPFLVIPPCRRPPETEKKVKQRKKQIYRRNISKKREDRE